MKMASKLKRQRNPLGNKNTFKCSNLLIKDGHIKGMSHHKSMVLPYLNLIVILDVMLFLLLSKILNIPYIKM